MASVLAQLRTGMTRFNGFLSRIGAADSSAVSMAFENLPTSSGSAPPRCCLVIASLIVVDFAWCGRQSGVGPCFVALCARAVTRDASPELSPCDLISDHQLQSPFEKARTEGGGEGESVEGGEEGLERAETSFCRELRLSTI